MKMNIEDLRYWPIINYLPASVLKDIRMVYVLGKAGTDVLLATKDNELLTFGFNKFHCLGYDYSDETIYNTNPFQNITELSGKRVKGFACNMQSAENAFVLAYLECGEVYLWGLDPCDRKYLTNPKSIVALPKTVTEVACGTGHILALTSDGEVFTWGDNRYKQVNPLDQRTISTPEKINDLLSDVRFVKISCGLNFSVLLTSDGVVYSWGQNDKGQLGLNKVSDFEEPVREIEFFRGSCIKNIACGSNHVLALNSHGDLFSWGCNDYLQLGYFGIEQRCFPSQLEEPIRFKEVAASVNLSVGVSFDGSIKVWGKVAGEPFSDCLETPCQTIDQAFALYNCNCMYKPIEISPENETLSETVAKSFDNQEDCDFKFIVEKREIFVHKTILKLRCQYFKLLFQEHWREGNVSAVEINENYEAMLAFLKYLYTDKLEVDPKVALEVSLIADKYCEPNLIDLCLQKFEEGLNCANLAKLYELTRERKMMNFGELCIDFAARNLKSIVKSKGFRNWKNDTVHSFFAHDKIIQACGN